MKNEKIIIGGIPAIIWGKHSEKAYVHVHGKFSCKEEAETFAGIAEKKGYQTISFDLPEHGERKGENYRCDIWNGMRDLSLIADFAFPKWTVVSLFACSLGAYFSLNAYQNRNFSKCLFQSPIVNMEYLIREMFIWFDVSEERLRSEGEIQTPIDPLRWDYYQYVFEHPILTWNIPTAILYGAKDRFQSAEIINAFAAAHECQLTVSETSDHPFMQPEDIKIVTEWLEKNV
jgi:hypothetical protein